MVKRPALFDDALILGGTPGLDAGICDKRAILGNMGILLIKDGMLVKGAGREVSVDFVNSDFVWLQVKRAHIILSWISWNEASVGDVKFSVERSDKPVKSDQCVAQNFCRVLRDIAGAIFNLMPASCPAQRLVRQPAPSAQLGVARAIRPRANHANLDATTEIFTLLLTLLTEVPSVAAQAPHRTFEIGSLALKLAAHLIECFAGQKAF